MDQSSEFESAPDAYAVRLSNFEGPLDLLLHLIKKNEVNIYDIPIALITTQYLDAIELMQELNLDVAGEFLVDGGDAHPHQVEDAAAAARNGRGRRRRGRGSARRCSCAGCSSTRSSRPPPSCCTSASSGASAQWQRPDERVAEIAGDDYEPELEVDLFSLMSAFQAVRPAHQAAADGDAADRAGRRSKCGSSSCSCGCPRPRPAASRICSPTSHDRQGLIVTFLALLEMIRLKLVRVFQSGSLRADSRLQAIAPDRCAASDWRSGGTAWLTEEGRPEGEEERGGEGRAGGTGSPAVARG